MKLIEFKQEAKKMLNIGTFWPSSSLSEDESDSTEEHDEEDDPSFEPDSDSEAEHPSDSESELESGLIPNLNQKLTLIVNQSRNWPNQL